MHPHLATALPKTANILAVAGIILAAVALNGPKLAGAVILCIALFVASSAWLSRTWQIAATIVGATAIAVAGIAVVVQRPVAVRFGATPAPTRTVVVERTPAPAPYPKVTIIDPPPPAQGATVNGCLDVTFKVDAPTTWGFALATREGTNRYYFEGTVIADVDQVTYRGRVTIGNNEEGRGVKYVLHIVAIDPAWLKYLRESRDDVSDTWWVQAELPPGGKSLAALPLQRDQQPLICK